MTERLVAVDAFRGLTIVAMILVNNPGNWGAVYAPLLHATWHGWTPTDLVFPFFLFIVGVAIVLALGRYRDHGAGQDRAPAPDRRGVVAKIVRRSAVLFALGLVLSGYPFGLFGPSGFERLLETWRIPGVLQRIAVCYLLAALLFLFVRRRTLRVWTVVLLVVYAALIVWVPVPGIGMPDIGTKGDHLPGWVDRAVFGQHVWSSAKVYDPEGLLSTAPALATTLFGVLAGLILVARRDPHRGDDRVERLFVAGSLLVVAGYVWSWFLPINKALWTSSYAVFTAGQAFCALALCVWFFDCGTHRAGIRRAIARPLAIYGRNAIVVFVGSGLLAKTLIYLKVGGRSFQAIFHETLFASWLPPKPASLAYAVTWVLGWYALLAWMDRRGVVVKV